jgi:RNA ligase
VRYLSDILDTTALKQQIEDGYITARSHPDDTDLVIFNYTPKAQYERHWTPETRKCRGLIAYGIGCGEEIVAQPFSKFFNYGEEDTDFDLDERVTVTDKADGSLGILYRGPDGQLAIATRGSFTSDQAIHATNLLRTKYPDFDPPQIHLFEIIYPENRIVLDYGDMDDLILLAPLDSKHWTGPRVETFPYETLREALEAPPRPNAEGFVIHFDNGGARVKIKQEDYLALHRIVTGLSELSIWRHALANEGDITALLDNLPDEFHQWVKDAYKIQRDAYLRILFEASLVYDRLIDRLGQDVDRRTFALEVQALDDPTLRPLMFLMRDERDVFEAIWKRVRPTVVKEYLHDEQ